MLKILFDSSAEEDNRRKAADNLVYLSKDEPGAERIFREGGPTALTELVDQTDPYVKLSAIRTLSALCNGHQARVCFVCCCMQLWTEPILHLLKIIYIFIENMSRSGYLGINYEFFMDIRTWYDTIES